MTGADADLEILEIETPFKGFFRVDRYRFRHRLYDGGWSRVVVREVFERGHAAAILLYDPARDRVVLIEQVRIASHAGGGPLRPIELVAGIVGADEAPEEVARQETQEETGLTLEALEPIGGFFASPGGSSEYVTLFLGRVDAESAGGVHGKDDEDEDIRALVMTSKEAFAAVASGRINTAAAVIGLQWLALNHDSVHQRWR